VRRQSNNGLIQTAFFHTIGMSAIMARLVVALVHGGVGRSATRTIFDQ